MARNPIGYLILTSTPPEQIRPVAALVEELGYGELWVAEDYFAYDGFVASEAALAATSTIDVGLGIVSSVVRHPAVTAMAISSIARSHPGRFKAGIGHGLPLWTAQMGLTPKSPLTSMEECITAIRALLDGESVTAEGQYFTFRDISLGHVPTTPVPLLTGVVGPKSLELSGRIADGTILSVLAGPAYVKNASEHIRVGAAISGRESHELPVLVLTSVSHDREAARAAIRPVLAFYMTAMLHSPLTGALGWNDEIAAIVAEGGADALAQQMPDEWLDELSLAGSPADIERGVRRLLDAGATSVVLSFNPETAVDELRLISSAVLPHFTQGSPA